jgi:putative hemolysin
VTPFPWFDLLIIAGLIVLNGIFAMSELAIVSARTARLEMARSSGSAGAKTALSLAADPGKFLSTVQIGITLVGIVAGAYSGSSLGGPVGERLAALGVPASIAPDVGFVLVIVATTYASLVIGELVPKQLALRQAERIAITMARPMAFLSRVAAPFVWLLDKSSSTLVRLLGIKPKGEASLSAEELHMIFAEATRTGVIEEESRAILSGVMRLENRPVRELMTPRTEIDWLDINSQDAELRADIAATPHSLLPVADGSPDIVLGVVKVREVLAAQLAGNVPDLRGLARKPEVVPDRLDAIDALRILQASDVEMAIVHDEYGHVEGIVTTADLLEAIVGSFASHFDEGDSPLVVERQDGSLLIAGSLGADGFAERLDIELPANREFATAAGYVLWKLKHLPTEGEAFADQGWTFEVIDLDGRRIDKILATRAAETVPAPEA